MFCVTYQAVYILLIESESFHAELKQRLWFVHEEV